MNPNKANLSLLGAIISTLSMGANTPRTHYETVGRFFGCMSGGKFGGKKKRKNPFRGMTYSEHHCINPHI